MSEKNLKDNKVDNKESIEQMNLKYGSLVAQFGDNCMKQRILQKQFEEISGKNSKLEQEILNLVEVIQGAAIAPISASPEAKAISH